MQFEVRARRWDQGWEPHITEKDVTQSHSLAEAEAMVRDYLAVEFDADPASFEVRILPEVDDLESEAARLREEIAHLQRTQAQVVAESRDLARRSREHGLTGVDTSLAPGISPQRVSRLLKVS